MSISWQNLRPLENSLNVAFEELCCQLAEYERVPNGAVFTRKGAPDAGIECYWRLKDNTEWGWQAKFFLTPPNDSQWSQVDKSVKTALEKHPGLSRFVVCFPIDRQDPRIDNQKWFMDKWYDRVKVWEGWASDKNVAVVFEYWGEHEIFERLSREEHRGRYYFWFHRDLFSSSWFDNRVAEAVANVGPRYTPELDVRLPIARLFDSLGKTTAFYDHVNDLLRGVKKHLSRAATKYVEGRASQLETILNNVVVTLDSIKPDNPKVIDWTSISKATQQSIDIARDCADTLMAIANDRRRSTQGQEQNQEIYRIEGLANAYWRLQKEMRALAVYAESTEASLANIPALLLVAEAGKGKTHLLCDVAKRRVESGLPTILLLGGQFNQDEPWSQILRILGLTCSKEDFVGALETAAQARRTKALILIDALNEGQGKWLWKHHLAGLLLTLSRSPWISIAISVRTSYEDAIVPEGLVPTRLVRAVHHGFAEHEYEATRTFFDYYGIVRPSIPMLVPEFQNPLFLRIFCQGLKNFGLTRMPNGLQGITAVFKFFIDSVNKKLSDTSHLDFNPQQNIVWRAVEALAAKLATEGRDWLPVDIAQNVINAVLPRDSYERSLFRHLLSEGVIAESRFYIYDSNEYQEGVHFAYERFTDHLVAKCLLQSHIDVNNPSLAFENGQPLHKFTRDYQSCTNYQGLIEAFSIQIPEYLGKELVELSPLIANFGSVIEAFIQSLVWRDPAYIFESTRAYINTHVIQTEYTHSQFLNTLLTVASNPRHPYNADFLHRNLKSRTLTERDSWWSIFLHEQYRLPSAAMHLLEWAWASDDKNLIEDGSVRLWAVALAWYLTSSNRFVRDRATKALVCLLDKRLHILREVLKDFWDVNDVYVLERLMAVAYGCTLRSEDDTGITALAQDIYDEIFHDGMPPVHILTRDYARGVVEVAIMRGLNIDANLDLVRPPYSSSFPTEIPTKEELRSKYYNLECLKTDGDDGERGQLEIWVSVMSSGDFARYIIGTNSNHFRWSSRRLNEHLKPTRKQAFDAFVSTLTPRQKKALEGYGAVRDNVSYCRRLDSEKREKEFGIPFTDEELDELLGQNDANFRLRLGKRKSEKLTGEIIRYMDNPYEDEFLFDLSIAQHWILNRVFELGWTKEQFGVFDRRVNYRDGREAHKAERIGKKYQWIAYHEFLAMVADNFEFRGNRFDTDETNAYLGPWQINARDIDPSWALPSTRTTSSWDGFVRTWWTPGDKDWRENTPIQEWVKSADDLPLVPPLLSVNHPNDDSQWLVLDASYRWQYPGSDKEGESIYPKRNIHYFVDSYIMKKADMPSFASWAKTQWLGNKHALPHSHSIYDVFIGEYFWSSAFEYFNVPYYHHEGWVGGKESDTIPVPILVTSEHYSRSARDFDCSLHDDGVDVYFPSQWIVESMGLKWRGVEGHFYTAQEQLVAFDPSVRAVGPGALLFRRDALIKHLDEHDLTLVWVVLGEKLVVTGRAPDSNWPGRLLSVGVYTVVNNQIVGEMNTHLEQ